ncbi:MAG: methylmalonyl-CoA epimerase [Thermoplasmata archaeon]|nr:methylmalonyl-CoA epimerase [Thermoplasmata archaeon]
MQADHIGIAVRSIATTLPHWERTLGVVGSPPEEVPTQKVRVAFLAAGDTHIEFLEPMTPDSAVGKFLDARGEGMHHLAFAVPNVDLKLAELAKEGARLIDKVSRPGARGRRVGFVHPSAMDGVLVEFVQTP